MNPHHKEILAAIKTNSGKPTAHTLLDSYLGTTHPRYPINVPTLRIIAKIWMKDHLDLPAAEFRNVLSGLIQGVSSTEKVMAGILLGMSARGQWKFDPIIFDQWLSALEGWAEVDSLCTGPYTISEIPERTDLWKKILINFSKSSDIHKRRASLVLFCSPLSKVYRSDLATLAFNTIKRLRKEDSILITKAISWLLRSMIKLYKEDVRNFVDEFENTLPKIAVRETRTKLLTGKKTSFR